MAMYTTAPGHQGTFSPQVPARPAALQGTQVPGSNNPTVLEQSTLKGWCLPGGGSWQVPGLALGWEGARHGALPAKRTKNLRFRERARDACKAAAESEAGQLLAAAYSLLSKPLSLHY
jgi:hypothetical protein